MTKEQYKKFCKLVDKAYEHIAKASRFADKLEPPSKNKKIRQRQEQFIEMIKDHCMGAERQISNARVDANLYQERLDGKFPW